MPLGLRTFSNCVSICFLGKGLNLVCFNCFVCACRYIKLLEASETDGFLDLSENMDIWTGMIIE